MKRFLNAFRYQGLFTKIFIVMVISIIAVSALTSLTTIRMSERLFMKTFSITNSKVLYQIKTSVESFNYSIVTAANNILQSGSIKSFLTEGESDSLTVAKTYYSMNQQMKRIQSNVDAYEVGITLVGMNGRNYATDRTYFTLSTEELKQHRLTLTTLLEPKRLMYQYYNEESAEGEGGEPLLVATKALMERTTGDIYGTMYVTIREREFKQFYTNFTSEGNDVLILNREGVILSSNREELIGQTSEELVRHAREINDTSLDYKQAEVFGNDSILVADYLPSYDFYLVNMIDKNLALNQIFDMKTIVLICVIIVSAALIIVFLISRQITKSLTLFVRRMSNVTKHDFGNYMNVTGSYEIRELGRAYNYMLDELHAYIDRLVETQRHQRNAELAALQRQINPHFLYNTLASVKMLVQQGSKEKAAETINALISLLQNTISNVSETITVEEELANLKNYVFINHVRYGGRIRVNYFVMPDCMQARVPKLIIQPFIENAFFHAFNKKEEGFIHVLISSEGHTLICEVVDNGDGMEGVSDNTLPNPKSKRQLFTGIGVINVHERIKLLYGEEYGVTISSQPGEGTKVRVRLPKETV
ncbi:hypothetical protein DNH61_05600 [Paenibacillus sambharensis]|uniref:HAMP domain-containing protein n=1 Tax=Paenibacillus sambharensis TaxID=1803190 RepID=A0A2W1LYU7_9BACL|nr:sensor histidine kinase [Paenibacillus sambharensis]PZD96677.1 hypothetical protein DNH61_05600 [Paenibacillus sambharensis]